MFLDSARQSMSIQELVATDDWASHRDRQFNYLVRNGVTPSSRVLDIGCGPLRLGSALIPYLTKGAYYGFDINRKTLLFGVEILRHLGVSSSNTVLGHDDFFDLSFVKEPVDFAFSNSLMSHLSLNSILICLERVRPLLKPGAEYHSTLLLTDEGHDWSRPIQKTGNRLTFPNRDPYRYRFEDIEAIAALRGFRARIPPDYDHARQTMVVFTPV